VRFRTAVVLGVLSPLGCTPTLSDYAQRGPVDVGRPASTVGFAACRRSTARDGGMPPSRNRRRRRLLGFDGLEPWGPRRVEVRARQRSASVNGRTAATTAAAPTRRTSASTSTTVRRGRRTAATRTTGGPRHRRSRSVCSPTGPRSTATAHGRSTTGVDVNGYVFDLACPLCSSPMRHVNANNPDPLRAIAVASCLGCSREFTVSVRLERMARHPDAAERKRTSGPAPRRTHEPPIRTAATRD
jgi:hypothetical protein